MWPVHLTVDYTPVVDNVNILNSADCSSIAPFIIRDSVIGHLENYRLITNTQHGFVQKGHA